MSEEKVKTVCKALSEGNPEKEGKCEVVIKEFGEGKRDEASFNVALEKLKEITGLTREDLVKKISEMEPPP